MSIAASQRAGRAGQHAAGPGDLARCSSTSSDCRRRARSRRRPIRWSSPTPSASMPAAPAREPTTRVEIWAIGRRNPFLPWTGLDPWSVAGARAAQADPLLEIGRPAGAARHRAPALARPRRPSRRSTRPDPAARWAGTQHYAIAEQRRSTGGRPAPRSFLFLQGPISDFFDRLGARAAGARPPRPPDQPAFRRPAVLAAAGDRFPRPVRRLARLSSAEMLERHQVTDLVLHGDRRPYHIIAAEEARARGIAVIATDLGYVRPDWLTLEYDGMSTYSRFPRDPEAIRDAGAAIPRAGPGAAVSHAVLADRRARHRLQFRSGVRAAALPALPLSRHRPSVCRICRLGLLRGAKQLPASQRDGAAAKRGCRQAPGSYFLLPLQLSTDFQIRAHSPFVDAARRGARHHRLVRPQRQPTASWSSSSIRSITG